MKGLACLVWALVALMAPALAQTTAIHPQGLSERLDEADEAFRFQDYQRTITLLQPLMAEGALADEAVRVQVTERLGASYWFAGARDAARLTFSGLLKERPEHTLDPLFYPQELIAFFSEQRKHLEALGFIGPGSGGGGGGNPRLTLVKTVTRRDAPTLAYFAPFGVGQLTNGHSAQGTLHAVLQGIGLAANMAAWWRIESLKIDGSTAVPRSSEGEARLLENVWWVGTALLAGSYAYSVVDGLSRRPPRETIDRSYELLEPTEDPASPTTGGLDWRVGPSPAGLGIGLSGRF